MNSQELHTLFWRNIYGSKYRYKKQKGKIDVDAEKLIEKGMDQNDKNWKEKFDVKHSAKKEIMEIKHQQKIENKEKDLKKKSLVKEIFDGINTNKKLELEQQRKIEEERLMLEEERRKLEEERIRLEEERRRLEETRTKKELDERKSLGKKFLIIGLIITIVGFGVPGLQMIGSVGFIGCIAGFILLIKNDKKDNQK